MAGEDLRKAVLTKPRPQKQVGADKDNQSPLENPQNWVDAWKMIDAGWQEPKRTFYFVIEAGTIVDTAEKLEEIAEMSSTPKTFETVYRGFDEVNHAQEQMGADGKPMRVTVGAVGAEEFLRIKSKAVCKVDLWVLMNGRSKGVTKVINFRKPAVRPAGKPAKK